MAETKKIKPISFEDIRTGSPSSWDGIVKNLIESSISYNPKIPSAPTFGGGSSKSGTTSGGGGGLGGTEKAIAGIGALAGIGIAIAGRKKKNKKTGKWQIGIGKNKQEFDSEKEADDYKDHQRRSQDNPYSQKMEDGTIVYAKTKDDLKKKVETHTKTSIKDKEQKDVDSNIQKDKDEGYSDSRSRYRQDLREKDLEKLNSEKDKLSDQIADMDDSDPAKAVLQRRLDDMDAILNTKLDKAKLEDQVVKEFEVDKTKQTDKDKKEMLEFLRDAPGDAIINIDGERMTKDEFLNQHTPDQKTDPVEDPVEDPAEDPVEDPKTGFFSEAGKQRRKDRRQERKDRRTRVVEDDETQTSSEEKTGFFSQAGKDRRQDRRQDRKDRRDSKRKTKLVEDEGSQTSSEVDVKAERKARIAERRLDRDNRRQERKDARDASRKDRQDERDKKKQAREDANILKEQEKIKKKSVTETVVIEDPDTETSYEEEKVVTEKVIKEDPVTQTSSEVAVPVKKTKPVKTKPVKTKPVKTKRKPITTLVEDPESETSYEVIKPKSKKKKKKKVTTKKGVTKTKTYDNVHYKDYTLPTDEIDPDGVSEEIDPDGVSEEIDYSDKSSKKKHTDKAGKVYKGTLKESAENNKKSFNKVFGIARKKGVGVFYWNGKAYTTRKDTDTDYKAEK